MPETAITTPPRLTWEEQRSAEQAHRLLAPDDQPHLVVYFGMLSYAVLSEHPTREEAQARVNEWAAVFEEGAEMLPFTRNPSAGDIQIETQASLDHLTELIRG